MEILPINNLTRIIEQNRHDDRERQQRRQPPRKKERIGGGLVYRPDGEIEEQPPSKIDVVA